MVQNLRNICIIAHVDHGKTTLVDHLLRQSGTFRDNQEIAERVMDSMDLERERGITIMAKNTAVRYHDLKINIVDTPGHADFGGEVERIMGMVDGAFLLVDAAEGPLPQTRFVLEKALKSGLKVILVINKVDRPEVQGTTRLQEVENAAFDLFIDLGASDQQLDFPVVYACARKGWCTTDKAEMHALLKGEGKGSLEPLFQLVRDRIPSPRVSKSSGFQMLVSNLSYSEFVGRLAVGRVLSGSVKKNQRVIRHGVDANNQPMTQSFPVTQVYTYEGLRQVESAELTEGDIGVVAGSEGIEIGDTLAGNDQVEKLPRIQVEPPTLAMIFSVNTSPMAGLEGEAIQSRKLRERLLKEVRHNVAIRFQETETSDQFRLLGRGELQFGILIEQMRREGFEFMVGKPVVLMKEGENGEKLEPVERAVMDLPELYASEVTQILQIRKGILESYTTSDDHTLDESGTTGGSKSRVRLEFKIPTRGLLGVRSKFMTATRGEGIMSSELLDYEPYRGAIASRISGAMICDRTGETVEYALLSLEERGTLFMGPGVPVYEGMIIGENAKENDLNVNPCKEKKLTNIRSAHAEVLVTLSGIRKMSLEQCIEWLDDDEWIEVTPESIRMRKKVLSQNGRSVKRTDRE